MTSLLEIVPQDVLRHIAFLSALCLVFEPPGDILRLLLTSRTLYRALSVMSCPQLYADLFRIKFDIAAAARRCLFPDVLTTSSLSAELVQRQQMLRRVRRLHMSSPDTMTQDLFTAYMMIIESDGLNEMQLVVAGFPKFIATVVRTRLSRGILDGNGVDSLAVWSLWLTLSRQIIANEYIERREELLNLLQPFAISASRQRSPFSVPRSPSPDGSNLRMDRSWQANVKGLIVPGSPNTLKVVYYTRLLTPALPNLASASIVLTFALKEAQTFQIPPHLPPTRAIANAMLRVGPTMEDYLAMASYRTLLVGDTCPAPSTDVATFAVGQSAYSRSMLHDQDFSRMVQFLDPLHDVFRSEIPSYIPGTLCGLWEGTWMASPGITADSSSSSSGTLDFLCRQPMQCYLREHLCFSPHVPLPSEISSEGDGGIWNIDPHQLVETQEGLDLEVGEPMAPRQFRYDPVSSDQTGRDVNEALDVVVTGETLQEHSAAWGAYKFAGRVRLQDGLVVLKREPTEGSDGLGTWFFEGYLHSGGAFVGRWYSSNALDQCGIGGIFSMGKYDNSGN